MQVHRKEELWLLSGILLLAVSSGWASAEMQLCLLLGLLAYLAWQLFNLARLGRRLTGKSTAAPAFGLWKGIFSSIDTLQSDAQQREQQLMHSLNRFQDAASALPVAMVILGPRGSIDWMNPAAERLLGIDYPASAGRVFTHLVRDPVLDEYLDTGAFEQPLVFSPPANRSRIVSMCVTALGEQQQMIVARDITRQYHLDAAQQDFVANISHELRTPLTVISGVLEQLQGDEDGPARRPLELMQSQAIRMGELISDLLTISHLELNGQPPANDEVDVPALLEVIADEARALGKASGHIVQLEIVSAAGLRGDRKELRTAFSNLVVNAIRHTPKRTQVTIGWRVDEEGAYLDVSDNGEGIAARHLPRLAERLYRVDNSRSRDTGGTGLGLAIVKYILKRHGAGLAISSMVGRGSTFSCRFPRGAVVDGQNDRDKQSVTVE